MSHGDISKIESGKQPRPSGPKLAAYAKVLGVTAEWLMTEEGPRGRPPEGSPDRDPPDPGPARAEAIRALREAGVVSEAAIAEVRAYPGSPEFTFLEWCERLIFAELHAERVGKGLRSKVLRGERHGETKEKR